MSGYTGLKFLRLYIYRYIYVYIYVCVCVCVCVCVESLKYLVKDNIYPTTSGGILVGKH